MLTPDEVYELWWLLVFTPNAFSYNDDPPYEDIRYIAQDSNGMWFGFTVVPEFTRHGGGDGSWGINIESNLHRVFSAHEVHDGYDEHYYEVPRS